MNVDKNLFLYDLAFVAIMKNEGHYIKEWLDYHLFAGVNHFYIYDNESTDNMKEILQPYINAGIVTYIFYPGKAKQMEAYNDAVKKFRFQCRYMSFVDGDEFFVPKSNRSITEVADEILSMCGKEDGVIHVEWFMYGSNDEEKADYTRGVLERFTRRKKDIKDNYFKNISLPRKISFIYTPHNPVCFDEILMLGENEFKNLYPDAGYTITDKIVMNHYHTKSKEEYIARKSRGSAAYGPAKKGIEEFFEKNDSIYNEVFDDSILKYRAARTGGGIGIKTKPEYQKVLDTMIEIFTQSRNSNTPPDFFAGKIETFLTCRSLAEFFREKKLLDEKICDALENDSLVAIYKSFSSIVGIADFQLLMSELPKILTLKYPIVDTIILQCIKIIPQIKDIIRSSCDSPDKLYMWKEFADWDYKLETLRNIFVLRQNGGKNFGGR